MCIHLQTVFLRVRTESVSEIYRSHVYAVLAFYGSEYLSMKMRGMKGGGGRSERGEEGGKKEVGKRRQKLCRLSLDVTVQHSARNLYTANYSRLSYAHANRQRDRHSTYTKVSQRTKSNFTTCNLSDRTGKIIFRT